MISVTTVKRVLICLVVFCCHWQASSVFAYPLTDAQKARLEKLIPRTFAKLQKRDPVLIVTLGDSVTEMFTPVAETNHDYLNAYHAKFTELLCKEFFYPGGVRLLKPATGKKDKAHSYLGNEIVIENLGQGGRTSIDAVQRITTDAFLNDPDLVIIKYGINDALRDLSVDVYKKSIQLCIDECRKRGVDVILLAPSLVRISTGPLECGIVRGQTVAARELAAKNGVFFVDMGQAMASTSGVQEAEDAKGGILEVVEKIAKRFDFPGAPRETLHPNLQAHEDMGKALFDQLMNGEPPAPFRILARAEFQDPSTIEVELTIKNGSQELKEGYIGAMTIRKALEPTEESAFQNYHLEPGKSQTLSFTYKRQMNKPRGKAKARLQSLDPTESRFVFSFLMADAKGSRVLDAVPVLEPVAVTWKEGQQLRVKDGIRLDWSFLNGQDKAINGTYEIEMGGKKAAGKFVLESKGKEDFFAEFPINEEEDVVRFKEGVVLRVTVDGKSFVFHREIEAVRDLYLGEKTALERDEYYTSGVRGLRNPANEKEAIYMRADADKNDLYITLDLEGVQLLKIPNGVSMVVQVAIDGRPKSEVRQFGFIDPLRISFGSQDGPGLVSDPKMAVFGNGYDQIIQAVGIRTLMKTKGGTSRKIEIRVPRIYLYRHEWLLGEADQVIGLNVGVSLGDVGSNPSLPTIFPADKRWVLANSKLYYREARSLVTLNLGKKSGKDSGWSVRLY